MTDTEATAPNKPKKPKVEKTPEQEAQHQATRVLARALSKLEEGSPEEQKTRRSENKAKYSADARKLVKALTKEGISFAQNEAESAKAKRESKKARKAEGADTAADED